jgi:MoaA/NifB/PqqE/SkfB family radical SAM enzyme
VSAPRLTLITPTFARADTLAAALESALSQDFADFELLVLLDGADAASREIARDFASRDARVAVLEHATREGVPRSRNELCERARAELVAMLDSDDLLLPGALGAAVAFMDERPEVALAYGDVDILEEDVDPATGARREVRLRRDVRGLDWPGRHEFLKRPWSSHLTVFRKAAWREAGGFDATIARCWTIDLYRRIAARHPVARIPRTLYRVRFDGRNTSRQDVPKGCEACESFAHCGLAKDILAARAWRGHRVHKVAVFLTTRCNFDCSYCFTKKYKLDLAYDDVRRLLVDAKNHGARTLTISGGEPSLHERLDDVVDLACGALGLATAVITNGWRWPEARLRRLMRWKELMFVVSLEGEDEALHDRIRRKGSFGMIRDFIGRVRAIDAARPIYANVVITPENAHEIEALARFALDDLGIDQVRFDRAVPVGNAIANRVENAGLTRRFLERVRALAAANPGRIVGCTESHPGECPLYADASKLEVVAYASGAMTPCCFIHKDEALALGTIRDDLARLASEESIARVKRGLAPMFERFREIEREKGTFTCVECQEEYQRIRGAESARAGPLRPLPVFSPAL